MSTLDDLKLLIRSRHPLITLETVEESKAMRLIGQLASSMNIHLYAWSMTEGLVEVHPQPGNRPLAGKNVGEILRQIIGLQYWSIFVFKDLCSQLHEAEIARSLRDVIQEFMKDRRCVILLDAHIKLPESLRRLAVPVEMALPDAQRLEEIIRQTYRDLNALQDVEVRLTREQLSELSQNLRGLTEDEARMAVSRAILEDGRLDSADIAGLLKVKKETIFETGLLDYIGVDSQPVHVGGLKSLKRWLQKRRSGLSREAREFGLEPPKGVLLLGVQGCGKRLTRISHPLSAATRICLGPLRCAQSASSTTCQSCLRSPRSHASLAQAPPHLATKPGEKCGFDGQGGGF